MNSNEPILQAYLLQAQENFAHFLAAHNMPSTLSLHIAPDMCWIASEHEYHCEFDESTGHKLEFVERKPPACAVVVCKI